MLCQVAKKGTVLLEASKENKTFFWLNILLPSALIQSAMGAPSRKSVQVAQMKCMGCLEKTQSCRERIAGDSKTKHVTSPSLSFSAQKYPLLFLEQQPDNYESVHPP